VNLTSLAPTFAPFGSGVATDVEPTPADCGTDLMARGSAWLTGKLQSGVSQPVVYHRGNRKIAVCATFGRKLLKLDDGEGGVRMVWTDRDFLIPAASLVIAGSATLPKRGDRIRVIEGGATQVYEVLGPGGEPAWTWSDPFRRMLRIHGKHVGTE
jgi:hypothetical protein